MSMKSQSAKAVTITAKGLRAREEASSNMAVRHSEMAGLQDYFSETDSEVWESGSAKASSSRSA
jgi:hypothetical protein